MALSVSYWSPMEKLILHLSPVARRRTLKNNSNNVNKTSSLGRNVTRHRNKSEPNVKGSSASSRAASLKNVSVYSDPHNSLDCDVKTLRLFCINQVRISMQYFFAKKCIAIADVCKFIFWRLLTWILFMVERLATNLLHKLLSQKMVNKCFNSRSS